MGTITSLVNYRVKLASFTVLREASPLSRPKFDRPDAAARLVRAIIPDDAREHFVALYLDTQNRLVAAHTISSGTLSASLVAPREVFGPAMRLLGVAALIIAHNHPSGDPAPSQEDIRLTRRLVDAGKLLELTVHDHLVVGNGTEAYVSFAERGLL